MNDELMDLYKLPDIGEYEDLDLLTLRESCAVLEEQVYEIASNLPDGKRQVIEAYISVRNDLEVETVKAALRWSKRHLRT